MRVTSEIRIAPFADLTAVRGLLDRLVEAPGFGRLDDAARITMGSPMAHRQLTAGDIRAARRAVEQAEDGIAEGGPHAGIAARLAAALAPISAFAGASGLRFAPDDLPITTDAIGRRLAVGQLRRIRDFAESLPKD
jgi:hypothetical protein